jgi:FtsX-like permease family
MPSAPSTRLSTLRVAWCHLSSQWDSSVGAALALLLALLPAGLVLVDRSGARSDLHTVIAAAGGLSVQRSGAASAQAFDLFQRQAEGQVAPALGMYMDAGSAQGAASPFRLASLASNQPSGPAATADVTVTYVADLSSRVDVVQGLFPRPGAGGGERMVTMPLPVADRIGAQLFDVVCLTVPNGDPNAAPWCARIVGLWRPMGGADPAWTAPNAKIRLFAERDDFFAAAALQPAQNVQAARQYAPRAGEVTPQNAGAVAQQVKDVRSAVGRAGAGQVVTTLDTALAHYAATSVTSFPVELLAAALVPLLTLLALVMARWYVEPRLHELALLRARGWSRRRVQRLVLAELALLGAPAVVVAVAGLLAVLWQATDGAIGARPASLSGGELLAIAVAVAVLVVAAVRFFDLARWAARQSVLRLEGARKSSEPPFWLGGEGAGVMILPAAMLLLVPRVSGAEGWHLPGPLDDLGALVSAALGVVLLVIAALPLLSTLTGVVGGRRAALEGTIANQQLRRWWQRHAAPGFLVVLAFGIASYAAVALVDQLLSGPGGALGLGIAAGLAIGFVTALATTLLAYGLLFLVVCRSRVDYYAALLVDGLPATTVRRSVEIEQQAVLVTGLTAGLVIGMLLLAATASGIGLGGQAGTLATPPQWPAVIAGVGGTAALGLIGGLMIAGVVRRGVVGFRLVELGWRAT